MPRAKPWPEPFRGAQVFCALWVNSYYARLQAAQGDLLAPKVLTPSGAESSLLRAKRLLEEEFGEASLGKLELADEDPALAFSWKPRSWSRLLRLMRGFVLPWSREAKTLQSVPFVYADPSSFRLGLETNEGWFWFSDESNMRDEDLYLEDVFRQLVPVPTPRGPRLRSLEGLAVSLASLCEREE